MASSNNSHENNDGSDPFEEFFKKLSENGGFPGGNFDPSAMGIDPEMMKNMGGMPIDPAMMQGIFAQVSAMMSSSSTDEPVNWDLARQTARQVVSADGDASVTSNEKSAVADATQLADLWLDPVTAFERPSSQTEAWSKSEYVENTFGVFQEIAGPIAESMSEAMNNSMDSQLPEEIKSLLGGQTNILSGIGGMMFGAQAGQSIGKLASEVVSSTDVGLPMAEGRSALVPAGIKNFGEGLEIPAQEVMLYLAVREAALVRLYKANPWLRQDIIDLVKRYARGIHVDIERMQDAAQEIDPMNPDAMQEAFAAEIFTPQNTEDQQLALARLETLLALVEGWVTVITEQATKNLPMAAQLAETMNRRHANGGPAEHIFAALVGLELHPRKNREAANFWRAYGEEHGKDARDELWSAPETLPTGDELDDLDAYTKRVEMVTASDDEFDAALEKLLSGGYDEDQTPEKTETDDASENKNSDKPDDSDSDKD